MEWFKAGPVAFTPTNNSTPNIIIRTIAVNRPNDPLISRINSLFISSPYQTMSLTGTGLALSFTARTRASLI